MPYHQSSFLFESNHPPSFVFWGALACFFCHINPGDVTGRSVKRGWFTAAGRLCGFVYALQARACWSGCMLSRPHSRTPGRSRCACCAQLRAIWHLAARVDSICTAPAAPAIARAALRCAHFRCSARAYPQQISFVSAHASIFPARAVTSHAQLFMFSMEYLFFLLCARYCQTCARCGLAVRYFPFHCLATGVEGLREAKTVVFLVSLGNGISMPAAIAKIRIASMVDSPEKIGPTQKLWCD